MVVDFVRKPFEPRQVAADVQALADSSQPIAPLVREALVHFLVVGHDVLGVRSVSSKVVAVDGTVVVVGRSETEMDLAAPSADPASLPLHH